MSDDYGFYGKGDEGYVHYMQAFNESQKGGGVAEIMATTTVAEMVVVSRLPS